MKKGKSGVWKRAVNRKFNHRLYEYVPKRVKELCEVAGVQPYIVPSAYTNRTCPECEYQDKLNRSGKYFKRLQRGYEEDADIVSAKKYKLNLYIC
ncbi:MAG: zinc ribbon domain-containing protein [Candidatus Aenigmatarchaeota archaeon]